MLSNAYFLAKFRFDTAENEPAKNLQKFAKFANFAARRRVLAPLRRALLVACETKTIPNQGSFSAASKPKHKYSFNHRGNQ